METPIRKGFDRFANARETEEETNNWLAIWHKHIAHALEIHRLDPSHAYAFIAAITKVEGNPYLTDLVIKEFCDRANVSTENVYSLIGITINKRDGRLS